MASYRELKSQAEDLMRQAEAARKAEIGAAIANIKEKMATYGITLEDLGGKAKARRGRKPKASKATATPGKAKAKPAKARKPVAAKYRNAETNEAWSGRGRVPKWLAALEAAGRKREEFVVGRGGVGCHCEEAPPTRQSRRCVDRHGLRPRDDGVGGGLAMMGFGVIASKLAATGRAGAATWLAAELAKGRTREEFAVG